MLLFCAEMSHTQGQVSTRTCLTSPWIPVRVITVGNIPFQKWCVYITVTGPIWTSNWASTLRWLRCKFGIERQSSYVCDISMSAHDSPRRSTPKSVCGANRQRCSSSEICLSSFQQPTQQWMNSQEAKTRLQFCAYFELRENENLFSTWTLWHKHLYLRSIAHGKPKKWV